jgi:hypothetical protein
MDVREKLNLLGEAARYDDCSASPSDVKAAGRGCVSHNVGTF